MFFCDYPIIGGEKELPLYLLNLGQQHRQDHIIRTSGFPNPQILYSTKGSGVFLVDGERIEIPPNTAIFIPAYHPHEYYATAEIWDIHWVVAGGFALDEILKHFGLTKPAVYPIDDTKTLEHIFRQMHNSVRTDSVFGNYKASGYLYDFLIEFYRLISLHSATIKPNSAVIKAIDYVNSNYNHPITMENLCNVSGVSKQYLCLLFRKTVNLRPMEYIAKRRIQLAKELLNTTDYTVEEISEMVGFCTPSYFCKLFKRYEGFTALQFRNI